MDLQAEDEYPVARRWPPQLQAAAAVGWSSFLAACFGTMLTFAGLDPQVLIDGIEGGDPGAAPWWLTSTGIYTLGFFLFWLVAVVAGGLTVFLTQGPRGNGDGR
jgi:hypothetical protein